MFLRRDGDLAHPSTHGAAGIAHACAEQFRQRNEGHRSGPERMIDPPNNNRLSVHMSHRTRTARTVAHEKMKRMRRPVVLEHVRGHMVDGGIAAETDPAPSPCYEIVDVADRERLNVRNTMKFDEAARVRTARFSPHKAGL